MLLHSSFHAWGQHLFGVPLSHIVKNLFRGHCSVKAPRYHLSGAPLVDPEKATNNT